MKRGRNDEIRGGRKEVGGFCQFRTEQSQQEHYIDRSKWVSRPDRLSGHGEQRRRRVAGENVTGGRTLFREAERGSQRAEEAFPNRQPDRPASCPGKGRSRRSISYQSALAYPLPVSSFRSSFLFVLFFVLLFSLRPSFRRGCSERGLEILVTLLDLTSTRISVS